MLKISKGRFQPLMAYANGILNKEREQSSSIINRNYNEDSKVMIVLMYGALIRSHLATDLAFEAVGKLLRDKSVCRHEVKQIAVRLREECVRQDKENIYRLTEEFVEDVDEKRDKFLSLVSDELRAMRIAAYDTYVKHDCKEAFLMADLFVAFACASAACEQYENEKKMFGNKYLLYNNMETVAPVRLLSVIKSLLDILEKRRCSSIVGKEPPKALLASWNRLVDKYSDFNIYTSLVLEKDGDDH